MRRLAPLVVLCLAAGCGRDFSLPKAPGGGPRFLGPLAGFYQVDLPVTAGATSPHDVDVPVGTVLVLQELVIPTGGPDPVAGVFQDLWAPAALLPSSQEAFAGTYDSRKLAGTRTFDGGGTAPMVGTPIAGGDGLDLAFATCPGETLPPVTLHTRRVCDFEPQLSGIYAGHAGTCTDPGAGDAAYLGLGVRAFTPDQPAIAVAMRYPDTGQRLVGRYDRFTGCGAGFVFDATGHLAGGAGLTVTDDGTSLSVDVQEGRPTAGLTQDLCQPALGQCTSRFVGTRQSGTRADACQPAPIPGLVLGWKEVTGGTAGSPRLYLDVTAHVVGGGDIGLGTHALGHLSADRQLLRGVLDAPDGSDTVANGDASAAPANVALRFDLTGHGKGPWRIRVWAQSSLGEPFMAAMPACVVPTGP